MIGEVLETQVFLPSIDSYLNQIDADHIRLSAFYIEARKAKTVVFCPFATTDPGPIRLSMATSIAKDAKSVLAIAAEPHNSYTANQ